MSETNTVERPVKRYPLEIVNAGEDTYIVMSKGHHDPHEFMRSVRAEGYDWPLGMPEHKWVRAVPSKDACRTSDYVFTEPHARGAFPATYAWEDYNERSYEALTLNAEISGRSSDGLPGYRAGTNTGEK